MVDYIVSVYKVSFCAIIEGASHRESFPNNPLTPFIKGNKRRSVPFVKREFEKILKKCEFMDRHYINYTHNYYINIMYERHLRDENKNYSLEERDSYDLPAINLTLS